ncbi:MAG: inorganic diphosphatase [Candidatus Woesearchaeota archaeon]
MDEPARAIDFLEKMVTIHIDRPLGSMHPKHGFPYPVNYGYVPGVMSGDGEEMDAYLLGVYEPVEEYTGRCVAVIHRKDDDDDKLIVVPDGHKVSDEEIRVRTHFQEQWFDSTILK